ncbi:DUF7848 domain-containing protein [Streptomyces odontomachi]|uniref:DUF7848 domain-containing protein n=1 Tax=Streptomyces odontomachi TaxID=2944940 RepID=UPI00210D70C3|nr:hypothetical protein [Streptomyces sp. ODS25]
MSGNSASASQQVAARTTASGEGRARGVFRSQEHAVGPDYRPEAFLVTYTMYCGTCGAMGPTVEDGEDGMAWAVEHFKDNPTHLDYRELITRPYRAVPGAWL